MSENNVTQPGVSPSKPYPERRSILTSAGLASAGIGLLIGISVSFDSSFTDALATGFINCFLSMPITAFIILIYRAFKLPSRLELPVAVLAGGAGLFLILRVSQMIFD